jgi:poly-beta-1,6-N-acetyl-D-glucosamine synthase
MDRAELEDVGQPLACCVGIMAHNEAANIAHTIQSVLRQHLTCGDIAEIIVVASGCTDATVSIVTDIARDESRVHLIVQERREGKASAINLWLDAAQSPILLLVGADVLIKEGTFDILLGHFRDPNIGMVGAHPIPVNDEDSFLGHAVHLLWQLHDIVAREVPKLGETIAFRNVIPGIPINTSVDEISIQAIISQLGYRLVYEPRAIVYNRGPATVSDFLRQRRRIHAGHLRWQQQHGYTAATMSTSRVARALSAAHPFTSPQAAAWTLGTVGLETLGRVLGMYDYLIRRPNHVWQVVSTTKSQIAEVANAQSPYSVLALHIVGFHQQALELGTRASQLLVQQVVEHICQTLGLSSTVSAERNGTIIALLPLDREEAERQAQQLIQALEAAPVRCNGLRDGVPMKLACGIIAFSDAGDTPTLSLPAIASASSVPPTGPAVTLTSASI